MATYSTNLALTLLTTGEGAGTWGNTTNTNLGTLLEQAISGYVTQAVATGTDTTLTIPNGSTGVARNMYIELTGTGGTNTNLIVPANKKLYFIFNNSTGAVTVKVTGQTGVSVPTGKKVVLVSNGTDIVNGLNYIADFGTNSFTVTNLTATSATITTLTSTSAGITTLTSTSAGITTLTGTSMNVTTATHASANITTLTGTNFSATSLTLTNALGRAQGGTGLSTAPTNGQLLIGNGSGYALSTLTAGTGISLTNSAGSISISATATTGDIAFNSATISSVNTNQNINLMANGTGAVNVNTTTPYLAGSYAMNVFGSSSGKIYAMMVKSVQQPRECISFWNEASTGDNLFAVFFTESTFDVRGSITYNRGAGQIAYNTTSDRRAKTIYGPVTNSGQIVDNLKVYTGKMNWGAIQYPMMIADEAQQVTPYCVTGQPNAVDDKGKPIYQQMDYSALVPLLIAEVQSLRARVAELEAKN